MEALRGERTVAELGVKHGVHPTMITAWKKQALEGMAGVFSGKAEAADAVREGAIEKLHAKIGGSTLKVRGGVRPTTRPNLR